MSLKPRTTALELLEGVSLNGKTAIVTGANSGIGYEISRSLAKHDCQVIMACRRRSAGLEAVDRIKSETPRAKVVFMYLTLSELKSVKSFAEEFCAEYDKLHYLFLNAGTFGEYYSKTTDGYEINFQVNYLAHVLLTFLLKDVLVKSAPSRVILSSTIGHKSFKMSPSDCTDKIFTQDQYDWSGSLRPYCNAKLLGMAMAKKLSELWKDTGVSFYAFDSAHTNGTNLTRHWWVYQLHYLVLTFINYTPQQAAGMALFCALSEELDPDKHFYFSKYKHIEPYMANDPLMKENCWKVTLRLLEKSGYPVKA